MSSEAISVFIGMLPEMKITEPYSPSAARKGGDESGDQRGLQSRENHAAERGKTAGAEQRGGFFHRRIQIFDSRLHGSDDKRQANEGERDHDAERRECRLDAERLQPAAHPSVLRIDGGERNTGDRGGKRERHVDQRIQNSAAGKIVAHQRPGDNQSEECVDQRCDQGCSESQPPGRQGSWIENGFAELRPGCAAPFTASADSGMRTIRLRYESV